MCKTITNFAVVKKMYKEYPLVLLFKELGLKSYYVGARLFVAGFNMPDTIKIFTDALEYIGHREDLTIEYKYKCITTITATESEVERIQHIWDSLTESELNAIRAIDKACYNVTLEYCHRYVSPTVKELRKVDGSTLSTDEYSYIEQVYRYHDYAHESFCAPYLSTVVDIEPNKDLDYRYDIAIRNVKMLLTKAQNVTDSLLVYNGRLTLSVSSNLVELITKRMKIGSPIWFKAYSVVNISKDGEYHLYLNKPYIMKWFDDATREIKTF